MLIHDKKKDVKISFQPAKANLLPMVLVTLKEKDETVDQKVIPLDLYEATMTL